MQRLKLLLLFVPLVLAGSAYKNASSETKTKWYTLSEASEQLKKEKRPILIDLYTDWCGWCKVMDKKTYSNSRVSEYLSTKFYAVKVNAESRTAITWNQHSYAFNPGYNTHDFALYLTRGQLSYPTTVIIPADGEEPQAIPGYMTPKEFELILKYFGEGAYKTTPFDKFQKQFKGTW